MNKKSLMIAALGMGLAFAGSNAFAQTCEKDCEPPPPPTKGFCHNIGGPMELGANCDYTGCTFSYYDSGGNMQNLTVAPGQFLGIIIGVSEDNENAIAAHIAHGDGPIIATFDPPLHLASQGLNHRAANVECLAERLVSDPGN